MQDLLYVFSEFFGTLRDVDALSPNLVPLICLFSAAGALILSRFTGTLGGMSLLINGSALFIGAIVTNWLFQHVKLPVNSPIDGPLFMSLIGMTLASAPMLWWMQGDGARN